MAGAVGTRALTSQEQVAESSTRARSQQIIGRAVDFVEKAGDWLPSSRTLCQVSGVSERRLQMAFREICDTTPTQFFRRRALYEARARLLSSAGIESPVTHVAYELGFTHLGRFSHYYLAEHGEYPSATVQGTDGRAVP